MDARPPREVASFAATARVGITLDPGILLGDNVKKRAGGSTLATVRHFLWEFVAPSDPSSFPGGGRRARVFYADSPPPPPPPPPWKLAPKCRTISAKGALRQICLT